MAFSFVHCGDIHLGRNPIDREERARDFADAFRDIVTYSLENRVDFLLISGDFFDKRSITAEVLDESVRLLEPLKTANIPVVVIEGNHDKAFFQERDSWLTFLANRGYIYLLKPVFAEGKLMFLEWDEEKRQGGYLDIKEARIYGLGYLGATSDQRLQMLADSFEPPADRFVVLAIHAALGDKSGRAAEMGGGWITSNSLAALEDRVQYFALGHRHGKQVWKDLAFSPGAPENWDIGESGQTKGFFHVLVDSGTTVTFIPSTPRETIRLRVDVSEAASALDAMLIVENQCPLGKGAIAEIGLQGVVTYNPLEIDVQGLAKRLEQEKGYLHCEVSNEVGMPVLGREMGHGLSRQEIEKHVLKQLLEREGIEDEGMVDLVLQLKEMAIVDRDDTEIVGLVEQMVGQVQADVD